MEFYNLKSEISLNGKKTTIDTLVNKLLIFPVNKSIDFLNSRQVRIPIRLHMDALVSTLGSEARDYLKSKEDVADELAYRLQWFRYYSDTQLINYLSSLKNQKLNETFLTTFWLAVLSNITNEGFPITLFSELNTEIDQYFKTNDKFPLDADSFNDQIFLALTEQAGSINGLGIKEFRTVLSNSATIDTIRQIGAKYGVDVPKRLSKVEYMQRIVDEMAVKGTYKEEHSDLLVNMTLVQLNRFAKDNGVLTSSDLSKNASIEYLLMNADITKDEYADYPNDTYNITLSDLESYRNSEPYYVEYSYLKEWLAIPVKVKSSEKLVQSEPVFVPVQPIVEPVVTPTPVVVPPTQFDKMVIEKPKVEERPSRSSNQLQSYEEGSVLKDLANVQTYDIRSRQDIRSGKAVPVDGILIQNKVEVRNDDIIEEIGILKEQVGALVELINSGEFLKGAENFGISQEVIERIEDTQRIARELNLGKRKARQLEEDENQKYSAWSQLPVELRFYLSFFVILGKILLKLLPLILGLVALVLIYFILTQFINVGFINSLQDTVDGFVNKYTKFMTEKGLFQLIRDLFNRFFADAGFVPVDTEGAAGALASIIL